MSKLSDRRRDIRGLDLVSAERELTDLRRQLFNLRLQKERGEVKNNRQFPQFKADIARLMQHIGDLHHAAEMEAAGLLEEPEETELVPVDARDTAGAADVADESSEDAE